MKLEQKQITLRRVQLANPLAMGRELGAGRVRLLAIITGGHFGIHWFQQLFPVVLPSLKADLGLSDVQVGALSSVRQLINGAMDLPCGVLADSLSRPPSAAFGFGATFHGSGLLSHGSPSGLRLGLDRVWFDWVGNSALASGGGRRAF